MGVEEASKSLVFIVLIALTQTEIGTADIDFERDLPEDGKLNFVQLAQKYGRQVETYNVTTEDGYIIQLHRLVGSGKPVLMWHGILDSSDTFILKNTESSSIVLNEKGGDIWLGNSRGNTYSRYHVSMDPDKDKSYWDFSHHEMGYYDLPASIDFILQKTGHAKLAAIAHSQGCTMFYVLGATRPEYNDKVELMISMGPVTVMKLKNLPKIFPVLWPPLSGILALTRTDELFPSKSGVIELAKYLCSQNQLDELCIRATMLAVGNDPSTLDREFIKVVIGHFPAGTSRKVLDHHVQCANRGKFRQFDYGLVKNLIKYKTVSPPDYDFSKITMPVVLMCGQGDNIATVEGVSKLKDELPNVVKFIVMDHKDFDHIDYNLGKTVNVLVNPILIKFLNEYGYIK